MSGDAKRPPKRMQYISELQSKCKKLCLLFSEYVRVHFSQHTFRHFCYMHLRSIKEASQSMQCNFKERKFSI